MEFLGHIRRYLTFLTIFAALYTGWIFLSRYLSTRRYSHGSDAEETAAAARFNSIYGGTGVKILQFYAREAGVTEGTSSVLCYGVLNARTLKVDPPVAAVSPSPNRCVEIAPEHDTQYTLTATGDDGRSVSESFLLHVKPDVAMLPRVTSFRIEDHKPDYRGRQVFLISFGAQNVEEVDIDPPAFPTLHGAPNGRFYVAPERTTTYTLTVTGKRGHKAQQKLTVDVPPK